MEGHCFTISSITAHVKKKRAYAMKEKVRQTILGVVASCSLIQKLELVDKLQRIGVDYHYKEEIHELLRHVYDDSDDGGGSDDLYVTSLRFYLLRKHGYTVSSGKIHRCQIYIRCW